MITICNKYKPIKTGAVDVNIMRPHVLSNQWSHLDHTGAKYKTKTREQAVYRYSMWLAKELYEYKTQAVRDAMNELYELALTNDVNLICCCAPLACHGEIIKGMLMLKMKERGDVIHNAYLEPDEEDLDEELF